MLVEEAIIYWPAGNLADHCDAAGGHFDPPGVNTTRHVGDLGNIEAEEYPGIEGGVATFEFEDSMALLRGPNSIIGKAIVVHKGELVGGENYFD